jgi:hypothetical protein
MTKGMIRDNGIVLLFDTKDPETIPDQVRDDMVQDDNTRQIPALRL